ncbi:quinate dehydrogenase [Metschnikowia aff. pulcherrima]|uniref:Quinate dehydrogenase n=1 Tax=Metschnikowia aff. pulcherrima TaxID=2163413 RepID=A0A4P6XWR7_9ASCO|nr:quinate dehydrogenase [Metschnikowia aff. pulcherrima]
MPAQIPVDKPKVMSLKVPDFETIRSKEFSYKLFGSKITNSKSPLFQNFILEKQRLPHKYELLQSTDVQMFVQHISGNKSAGAKKEADLVFNGAAVTMPHKAIMADHVDIVDANAKGVGAINTIYVRFDEKNTPLNIGTNTDTIGIRDSFLYNSKDAVEKNIKNGKPGLVYGGGGASRAAVYALHTFLGCAKIYVVNRFAHEIEALAQTMKENGFTGEIVAVTLPEQAQTLEKPELVVLCVPDFAPSTNEEKTARATLEVFIQSPEKGSVIEMCYYPHVITSLYKDFESAGWQVISGIEPMIYQGIAQQVLWTGYAVEEMPVKEAIGHVYQSLKEA